jgi:hypothetical protein
MKILKKIGSVIGYTVGGIFGLGIAWFALKFLAYLGMITVFIFNMMIGQDSKQHFVYDFEIEAMKDTHTYVVSRYGGESELQYHFIREMDGAIHEGSTDANNSSIIEDGGNRVDVFIEVPEVGTGLYLKLCEWASFDGEVWSLSNREFVYHVPEGSVETGEYNIDLE